MSVNKFINGQLVKLSGGGCSIATTNTPGIVKPDGTTITIDANGTISADSGHTIVDESGLSMTKRSKLKFINATVTDDSESDTTIVEVQGGGTTIVQKPTVSVETYTYNGSEQGPTITGFDSDAMTITNATKTNAGTYTLTIALKNSSKSVWNDLTTADLTYEYTINKASFSAVVSINGYTYNGTKSTPSISNNPGNGTVTYYGRSESTGTATLWSSVNSTTYDAGTRYCYAVIAETDNYQSVTTPNTSFTIAKADFTATVSINGYTYAGIKGTPTISNNPGNGTVTYYGRSTSEGASTAWSSVTSTTYDAGTRYCYAIIDVSTNYNSYTTPETSFTIAKASFTASVNISGYTYAGTKSTPTVSNNPGNGTVTYYGRSTSSGTATLWSNVTSTTYDAGTRYCYAVITETTNYNGYTTGNTSFTITKATQTISVSPTSVTLNSSNLTKTVTISGRQGSLNTPTTSDSTVATATASGSTITINNVNQTSGSATISISAAATTNYAASNTVSVSVTADFLKIVTFADGTDEEIAAMLNAYYNDQITLQDMGWAVGNTRKIHLNTYSAPNPNSSTSLGNTDITLVIVATEHTDLATAINGHTKACITVQTREAIGSSSYNGTDGCIYVNGDSSYDPTFTKWSNLYMNTYINDKLLGAISYSKSGQTALGSGTSFKNMIKTSKHNRLTTNGNNPMTAATTDGSKTNRTTEVVTDTLFLPSYTEIYGNTKYNYYLGGGVPSSEEGTQFEYYKTTSNRIKYSNNNGESSGTAIYWWQGSPSSYYHSSYGYYWCAVNTSGSSYYHYGNTALGLAPAFAM